MLEHFVKNCGLWEGHLLKEFLEDCLPWEVPNVGAGEECDGKGAAQTTCD